LIIDHQRGLAKNRLSRAQKPMPKRSGRDADRKRRCVVPMDSFTQKGTGGSVTQSCVARASRSVSLGIGKWA